MPESWKKYEQVFAGIAMIVVALATYAALAFDGDPKTVPDVNALVIAIMAGFAFMRSAPAKVVKDSLKQVKAEAAEAKETAKETSVVATQARIDAADASSSIKELETRVAAVE